MQDLRDKHVVVTGATGPLGEALCTLALASGARVTAVSISRTMLDALRAELRQHDRLHVAECDLASGAGVEALFDALERGTGPVDAVIHAVGGFAYAPLTETSDETLEQLERALLRTPMVVTRAAVRRMKSRGNGRVILIGSLAAQRPTPNMSVYGALKAAVAHFVTSIAAELRGSGVTINALLPGTLDTPANRASMPDADPTRWVTPLAVAKVASLLLGEAGSGVSGALIAIPDGGT